MMKKTCSSFLTYAALTAMGVVVLLAAGPARAEVTLGYVTDGLVACWDGIDNAATGVHDPYATEWTDLVAGRKFVFNSGVTVNGNNFKFPGNDTGYGRLSAADTAATFDLACKAGGATIEVVVKSAGGNVHILLQSPGVLLERWGSTETRLACDKDRPNLSWAWGTSSIDTFSVAYASYASGDAYVNGVKKDYSSSKGSWSSSGSETILGMGTKLDWGYSGYVYAIRVYNRELTADERNRNQLVDAARFKSGSETLAVEGTPEALAAVVPSYGIYVGSEATATRDCSAPEVWTNDASTVAATCLGYAVYTNGATYKQSSDIAFEYVHPAGSTHAEILWKWGVEYKVTATAAGAGSVSSPLSWVGKDETLSLVASLPAGDEAHAFYCWTNQYGTVLGREPNLSITVMEPLQLTAVFKNAYHVSPTGDDGNSGESADAPLKTIAAALAKDPAATILLADGVYDVTQPIVLTDGAVIRGKSVGAKAVVRASSVLPASPGEYSVFVLQHAKAELNNIAITTKAYGTDGYGRGVRLEGMGIVDGCIITNCFAYYNKYGGAVYLNGGGTVRNSILDDNSCHSSGGGDAYGGNVYMTGGTVENCTITRGCLHHAVRSACGGVYMKGGTLRGCLVALNTMGQSTLGNYMDRGFAVTVNGYCTIENCTIAGNYQNESTTVAAFGHVGEGTIRNCIIWGNSNQNGTADWMQYRKATVTYTCCSTALTGTGNTTENPNFVDAVKGNFRTGLGSGVDKAVTRDWMANAVDLDGHARILGAGPDMGCYEYVPKAIACGASVSTDGNLDSSLVTFIASVTGDDLSGLVYTWKITEARGSVVTQSGADLATLKLTLPTGRYTALLEVENDNGDTDSDSKAFEIFPKDIYVSTNGTGVYPYDSYASGTNDLQEAMTLAADGSVVHIADGFYSFSDTLKLNKSVTIVSENGPAKTKLFGTVLTEEEAMVKLSNASAVLSGVTVSGLDANGVQQEQWGGLEITSDGGTVTNCWIVNHKTLLNVTFYAGGGRLYGGTVTDCIVSNNQLTVSGGFPGFGGAFYVDGSTVVIRRCLFADNRIQPGGSPNSGGAAIYANKVKLIDSCEISGGESSVAAGGVLLTSGTMRNCLVAHNKAATSSGVSLGASGIVENCTVVTNESTGTSAGLVTESGAKIRNTIVWGSAGASGPVANVSGEGTFDHCSTDNANLHFKSVTRGDWRVKCGSPAVNAGVKLDWMTDTATDLLGNPRVKGGLPDLGCYENPLNGLLLLVR